MKCDKLQQVENPIEWGLYYDKSEVDSAIDELKREHHKERHEYIDMVASFKAKLVEQESENRRLKRALWLARAWGANQRTKYLDFFLTGRAHAIRKYKWIKITSKCRAKAEEYK